jgi:hypothetical protein
MLCGRAAQALVFHPMHVLGTSQWLVIARGKDIRKSRNNVDPTTYEAFRDHTERPCEH